MCAGAALSHFELFTFGKRHLGSSSRAPCVCVCVPCNNYLIISALVRLCLNFLFFFFLSRLFLLLTFLPCRHLKTNKKCMNRSGNGAHRASK
jgi:hypothetical protein